MFDEFDLNEVWSLYAEEGSCSLDEIEESLLILQDIPTNSDALARLFRAMHTFKGNSRMLGLSEVESVAHVAEDMIGYVRDDGVALSSEMVDLLLEVTDTLRVMLDVTVSSRQDVSVGMAGDLIQRLKDKMSLFADTTTMSDQAIVHSDVVTPIEEHDSGITLQSIVFDLVDTDSLARDPVYREIFFGMAHEVLHEIYSVMDSEVGLEQLKKISEEADRLHHAANQIGMRKWLLVLQTFLEISEPNREQAEALLSHMQELYEKEQHEKAGHNRVSDQVDSADPVRSFFNSLALPLGKLSQLGREVSRDPKSLDALKEIANEIRDLAQTQGFVRITDIVDQMIADDEQGEESLQANFARLEFLLYEELVSVADVMLEDSDGMMVDPRTALRIWCADHLSEHLIEMRHAIERIKRRENLPVQCGRIIELMRQVYHACLFYEIGTAAHLSMSIIDLFARAKMSEQAPDALLMRILASFIHDIELIMDVIEEGETPDMAKIEVLLQEASEAAFVASGTQAAAHIEARLGLPRAFHKVLTPESVKSALLRLESGAHFYIVRSDLDHDEEIAANFLNWVDSGVAHVISNVTVFEGDRTLFDFLIASPLDDVAFNESLRLLDLAAQSLRVEVVLTDRMGTHTTSIESNSHQSVTTTDENLMTAMMAQSTISGDMLEYIGELVTGQSMVKHLLTRLFESDLVHSVESEVEKNNGNWSSAKGEVRHILENWQTSVEKTLQLEAQNTALLNRLQEDALNVRLRPASVLLKPLVPFVEGMARTFDKQVALTTVGDDIELDFSMLDSLKLVLRALLTFCVSQSIEKPGSRIAAGKIGKGMCRVVLIKHDDYVSIMVEDDGVGIDHKSVIQRGHQLGLSDESVDLSLILREGYGAISNGEGEGVDLAAIRTQLRQMGGELRVSNNPLGGTRFFLTQPLAMVVMDGMVVKVGEIQYIVPIDAILRIVRPSGQQLVHVSADKGHYLLRLEAEDVLPIRFLPRSGSENAGAASMDQSLIHDNGESKYLFMVIGKGNLRIALSVDELIGQQQVMVHPLQGYLSGIRGVSGCALLGSGEVGMVLDINNVLSQESVS